MMFPQSPPFQKRDVGRGSVYIKINARIFINLGCDNEVTKSKNKLFIYFLIIIHILIKLSVFTMLQYSNKNYLLLEKIKL